MWSGKLQSIYVNKEEWIAYDDIYGLSKRLGYSDPHLAWQENPRIQGSTNPIDYCVLSGR